MTVSFEHKSDFVERCRQGRAGINMTVAMRERGRSELDARLLDFSALGCRIDALIVGAGEGQIWIKRPGLESLPAQCVWNSGNIAGLCFDTLLHPAVAARFLPAPGSHAAVAMAGPFDGHEPLRTRQQIMAGIAQSDLSPLQRRKKPSGLGMFGRINRVVSRSVDHRAERRSGDAVPKTTRLAIDGEMARVTNISSSGIRVQAALNSRKIGERVLSNSKISPAWPGCWYG